MSYEDFLKEKRRLELDSAILDSRVAHTDMIHLDTRMKRGEKGLTKQFKAAFKRYQAAQKEIERLRATRINPMRKKRTLSNSRKYRHRRNPSIAAAKREYYKLCHTPHLEKTKKQKLRQIKLDRIIRAAAAKRYAGKRWDSDTCSYVRAK